MNYGLPYQGSKAIIAQSIINFLPKGKRLVDLFGGGGAITHCAVLSHKWEQVVYNEYNSLLVDLIRRAINGDFNYCRFRPEFITREKYFELKDKDGYVKYIWSFSNSGKGYLFGKDREHYKHIAHDLIVFGKQSYELESMLSGINKAVKSKNIVQRRLEYQSYVKKCKNHQRKHIELQRLEQLERLEQLQQLQQLQQLEVVCGDYREFKFANGDIVYCDPPYEGTETYDKKTFNHKEFYDFCFSLPYPLFFSSYKILDKRFKIVWAKQKFSLMKGGGNNAVMNECIYANDKGVELIENLKEN